MEMHVKDNIKEFTRWLDDVQKQQIPFAVSRALNDTAVDVQEAEQQQVQEVFDNRKRWWLKQQPTGIKVRFSSKNKLVASIFTLAHFAGLQEEGGTKKPRRSNKLAIPTSIVPKKYRTSKGAREMKQAGKNVFSTPKGVFRRRGKKKVEKLFSFATSARVEPRFGFAPTAEKTVNKRFKVHFIKRLYAALNSAKK